MECFVIKTTRKKNFAAVMDRVEKTPVGKKTREDGYISPLIVTIATVN